MANKKTLNELIDEILPNPVIIDMTYKYRNTVELSGWVLRKPKFIKHDKTGVESASLLLYQINNANGELVMTSFSCMVYVKDLVDQLKKQDKVIFVACVGKIRHHFKYGDYTQVLEMETIAELPNELAMEWEIKNAKTN